MGSEIKQIRQFGKFRLDVERKVLWHEHEPVNLPLKEIELLCALTENGGEVITKNELLEKVWADSYVEESNLSRHIYLLRKTFKDYGESEELIQTVPRRGYRFAGEVREAGPGELVIEKHSLTRTMIEEIPSNGIKNLTSPLVLTRLRLLMLTGMLVVVAASGLAVFRYTRTRAFAPTGVRSVAVLPFKSIGTDDVNAHRGLGMADLLITRLSSLREITVRPTSAITKFENSEEDSVGIGQNLLVDAVLEGTIYRTSDKVRITGRLIRVSDQASLWTGLVEKPLAEELSVQNEIASQVANALALNLSLNEKSALSKRYTASADASQLYVTGRYEWNKRNHEGMTEAQRLFRNAIDKDPNFALAYVGLADYLVMGTDAGEASIVLAKALELDPNLAEAHATRGFLLTFHLWDWQTAEASFKRSIELNPGYATAHHWYATLLAVEGRTDEAKAELRRALEINPGSYNFLADLGQAHYFAREYDKAEEYCLKALELFPDFPFAHHYLTYIYLQTGDYDKAVDAHIKSQITFAVNGPSKGRKENLDKFTSERRALYDQGGIKNYFEQLEIGPKLTDTTFYGNALRYSILGEKEKALDNLERAYEGHSFMMTYVKADPVFDPLRSEPRYQAILRKMKLEN